MFDRKSRILILLFSILLWAQLIFSLGLMIKRYWSVYTREFEIFLGVSPTRTDPLIDFAQKNCPEEANLLYLGPSAADKFYVRYQFYPRNIRSVWIDAPTVVTGALLERMFGPQAELEAQGACLLVDRLDSSITGLVTQMQVDPEQSLFVFGD